MRSIFPFSSAVDYGKAHGPHISSALGVWKKNGRAYLAAWRVGQSRKRQTRGRPRSGCRALAARASGQAWCESKRTGHFRCQPPCDSQTPEQVCAREGAAAYHKVLQSYKDAGGRDRSDGRIGRGAVEELLC